MSNYQTKTLAERKAWGQKMAAARAAKAATISGRGAYTKKGGSKSKGKKYSRSREDSTASTVVKALTPLLTAGLGAAGTAVGGPLLGAAGTVAGHLSGEAIKYFTGKGDYKVINNSLMVDDPALTPIKNKSKGGGDVFHRTEYLGDIISGDANTFKIQSFSVNPGLESTFEWLSQIACNYEEYEFEGIYFEFRSMSADALNSTNTALGQVIMAANYNAASPNFTNKQSMENYEGGISGKPSCSIRYFVECARNKTVLDQLYVRQGAVPSGQDQRLYDLCNFQIATNGLQGSNVNLGELWVVYQVRLLKPKLFGALGLYNSFNSFTPINTWSNAQPLGNTGLWNYGVANNIVGMVITGNTLSWSPPSIPQAYMLYINWNGDSAATIAYPSITPTNGLTTFSTLRSPGIGTSATACSVMLVFYYKPDDNVSNGKPTLSFSAGTLPSTNVGFASYMMQVPNTLFGI